MSTAADKANELVLTVRTSDVREVMGGRAWLDFRRHAPGVVLGLLGSHDYRPRRLCETDERRKQIVPYIALRYHNQVWTYTRGQAGGEDRLHSRWSIGIGGHINPGDELEDSSDLFRTIYRAANREMDEEVGNPRVWDDCPLGLISDDNDAVGRVHLGFAMEYQLLSPDISPRDPALKDGGWWTLADLKSHRHRLETWSQIVLDAIGGGL